MVYGKITTAILSLLIIFTFAGFGQSCPVKGSSASKRLQHLDSLKNRPAARQSLTDSTNLTNILQPGMDTARWSNNQYWGFNAYIVGYKLGGPETANCKTKDKSKWDLHIEIAALKGEKSKGKYMVCEITPAVTALHPEFKDPAFLKSLKGKHVYVEGWAFCDMEHFNNSFNGGRASIIWRATAWELHPMTYIQIIP